MKEEIYKQGFELLFLGLKISKPSLTEDEAQSIIINIGNWLQLKKLTEEHSLAGGKI